jgi:hypothetical protein
MPDQETKQATPEERIAHQAQTWRSIDKEAVANKQDRFKQRAEYRARQQLREVIDTAGVR